MLHITQNITLVIRKKVSPFTKELWRGFVVALFIHIPLLFIFRIAKLPTMDGLHLLPPVRVEIDLSGPEVSMCVESTQESMLFKLVTLVSPFDAHPDSPLFTIKPYTSFTPRHCELWRETLLDRRLDHEPLLLESDCHD